MNESRAKQFPIGASVRLAQLSIDPYPVLAQLHSLEPVSWIDEVDMWFITRRDDVEAILRDTETFTLEDDESLLNDIFGRTMISTDGAEHTRLRQPFHPPFLPKVVRADMSATIEVRAHALIDEFILQGGVDLVVAWSDKLALEMVMFILGLPIHNHTIVRGWFTDIGQALANFKRDPELRARGHAAAQAFTDFASVQLETIRTSNSPSSDNTVLGKLVQANTNLSDDDILNACRVIVFGGLETTAALLSNTVWALLTHPESLAQVLAQPALLSQASEETLRWEPPVQSLTRRATKDVTVHGVTICKDETLNCMIGAANRDPAYYDSPDVFDIERKNAKDHLSFAIGRHYCLGAALARLEAEIGLGILFERLPNLRFDPERSSEPRGHEFRSPPALWLCWDKPC
jgi:cytochrome P450